MAKESKPEPRAKPGTKRGERVAQAVYLALLAWIIVAGSAQILRDAVFRGAPTRDANACRGELASLRARLADATLAVDDAVAGNETASVAAYRAALGGPSGRTFDQRVYELVDGCPKEEAGAAYALARLRAAHEAMIRLDALEEAPARLAHKKALTPAMTAKPQGSL